MISPCYEENGAKVPDTSVHVCKQRWQYKQAGVLVSYARMTPTGWSGRLSHSDGGLCWRPHACDTHHCVSEQTTGGQLSLQDDRGWQEHRLHTQCRIGNECCFVSPCHMPVSVVVEFAFYSVCTTLGWSYYFYQGIAKESLKTNSSL